jgi:chromosomal replication initiation ATPase DnaA
LKRQGYNIEKIAGIVGRIYTIEPESILRKNRQKKVVEARSLFCFWANRELGIGMTEIAGLSGLTPSAISYSVIRGEMIAKKGGYKLESY